ncbi:MAG: hypothetical protein JWP10_1490, partial [Nocardioidaceae bacterium]|nr:hypothetical protein [Nocardioidaceae bacterium]
ICMTDDAAHRACAMGKELGLEAGHVAFVTTTFVGPAVTSMRGRTASMPFRMVMESLRQLPDIGVHQGT